MKARFYWLEIGAFTLPSWKENLKPANKRENLSDKKEIMPIALLQNGKRESAWYSDPGLWVPFLNYEL